MKRTPHPTILFLICLSLLIATAWGCSPPAQEAELTTSGDTSDPIGDLDDLQAALTAETVDDRPGAPSWSGIRSPSGSTTIGWPTSRRWP